MKKRPEISIGVCSQDCFSGSVGFISPEELEAIGNVFLRAAAAIRNKEHGEIVLMNPDYPEEYLADIGVDFGLDFSEENGLPKLTEIKVAKKVKK